MTELRRDLLTEQLKQIEDALVKVISILKLLEDDWEELHRWIIWRQMANYINLNAEIQQRLQQLEKRVIPAFRRPETCPLWTTILEITHGISQEGKEVNANLIYRLIGIQRQMATYANQEDFERDEVRIKLSEAIDHLLNYPPEEGHRNQLAIKILEQIQAAIPS
jgi:hypothetical protein